MAPVSDRIILAGMAFQGRHGVNDWEKSQAQRFEVDIELVLDLGPAGRSDDLERTVDYRRVYDATKRVVESTSFDLIEALATAISSEVLGLDPAIDEVVIRVRKPEVQLGGPLESAGVELRRRREG
jgi:dihydroneopterin aldolase